MASHNSITVSSAVTLADNAKLKFDGANVLFVGALDVAKTLASGDIFRINSGNLSVELK